MGKQVEFGSEPEVKIWEARRRRLSRAETPVLYVRIGGEIFLAKGRIYRKKTRGTYASLMHVLTGKHFLAVYSDLALATAQGRVEKLNEMEVIAWTSR